MQLKVFFLFRMLSSFLVGLFNLYEDLYFTYLEINPLGKFQDQPIPPRLLRNSFKFTKTSDSLLFKAQGNFDKCLSQ